MRRFTVVSKLINIALAYDPEMTEKLCAYHEKILEIKLLPMQKSFFLEVNHHQIIFSESLTALNKPDTVIAGTPLSLFAVILRKNSPSSDVQFSGDMIFAQALQNIFHGFNLDTQSILSKIIGESLAYQAGQVAGKIKAFHQHSRDVLGNTLKEYIEEEQQWIVSKDEAEDFFHAIDLLHLEVERLEAQVQHIAGFSKTQI